MAVQKRARTLGLLVVTNLIFSLISAVGSAKAKTYPPSEIDAAYVVIEVEVLSALAVTGHRYRVAALATGRQNTEYLPEEVRFEGETRPAGFKGFGDLSGFGDLVLAAPGAWKNFESSNLSLGSLFLSRIPFEIRPLSGQLVKYRARLVKNCAVHLEREEKKEIVGDSSRGIITIPKLVTRNFTRMSKPPCYDPSDRTFELGEFETKEVAQEKRKSEAEEAGRASELARAQRAEKIKARLEREAAELANTFAAPQGTDFGSRLKQALCPRTSARAKVAEISSFEFEKKRVESKQEKGYTSNRYERTLTIRDRAGHAYTREGPSGFDDSFQAIRSLKLEPNGCFAVELIGLGGYSERDVIKEIESGIADLVDRALRERAEREALAQ